MKFSIFIPTYNRKKDLDQCLSSIMAQSKLPAELLIIDDGNLPKQFIKKWQKLFNKQEVDFIYHQKNHKINRRGLAESKNKALELISHQIFFCLDDDTILLKDFCEKIMRIWEKNKDEQLIGIGGIIKNRRHRSKLEKYYHQFFGLNSKLAWDINRVGFQVWDEEIKEIIKGHYAHGGVCSYHLQKSQELKFKTFSGGRTGLEDVDFCARAKLKNYHFLIEPQAQLFHYHPPKVIINNYGQWASRKAIIEK